MSTGGHIVVKENVQKVAALFHAHLCSLVAQLVKNPPAMQETPVRFLCQKIHWRRDRLPTLVFLGFPSGSDGKESDLNAGDLDLIPGSGRSPEEEGIGYPLQYLGASLMAQLVKNTPAMWETWVQSLGWEDPLEKGKATHSSILA